ncbi:hypothetical protein P7K49_017819 [Saguinus oedipus]|uniref:Uncharacterized protein n=1 Tax=Saguinus oedipus TaxID=9490 RepID=A0ABQ9V3L4_SAGOE|nr:hypothetical protein P7K49_017819 [Saguinus oedipus]
MRRPSRAKPAAPGRAPWREDRPASSDEGDRAVVRWEIQPTAERPVSGLLLAFRTGGGVLGARAEYAGRGQKHDIGGVGVGGRA